MGFINSNISGDRCLYKQRGINIWLNSDSIDLSDVQKHLKHFKWHSLAISQGLFFAVEGVLLQNLFALCSVVFVKPCPVLRCHSGNDELSSII